MNKSVSKTYFLIAFILLFLAKSGWSQSDWQLNPRLSYYTVESEAEALLVVPEDYQQKRISITLSLNGQLIFRGDTIAGETILRFPITSWTDQPGEAKLVVWIEGNS